ncbi:hypothetical protein FDG2_2518 [Candidatus Protofrankia californiensis]|uniref:Uncharacterized protein n=1 Tax=Candidatus Protofrankia californiensis TaxID=1839754 RepID=A0A1C3NXV2_9ACTN|nr:hypothetical protein FDG2_2518 [Candidatus Protofrankia californiensis]
MLRRGGYDDVVSVEPEEPFMTSDEGIAHSVALLRRTVPRQAIPTRRFSDMYEWESQ